MEDRIIAHVDMDAFYASVEIRDNPSLAGLPWWWAEQPGSGGGMRRLLRGSPLRRALGHADGEAERLCPELVRLSPNFGKYHDVSRQVMEVMGSFSPSVEPLSLDEAFLDLTGTSCVRGPWQAAGRRIKDAIRERTRLTASVGIAPVKFVAKIASDLEKPDGLVIVEPGTVDAFLRPLPISRLWGVGPRTRDQLEGLGIRSIGDLAGADPRFLSARFGQHGEHLIALAQGRDERDVISDWDAKSYSHEETFARDVEDAERLEAVILDQSSGCPGGFGMTAWPDAPCSSSSATVTSAP